MLFNSDSIQYAKGESSINALPSIEHFMFKLWKTFSIVSFTLSEEPSLALTSMFLSTRK